MTDRFKPLSDAAFVGIVFGGIICGLFVFGLWMSSSGERAANTAAAQIAAHITACADSLRDERLLSAGLILTGKIQAERIEEAERLFKRIQRSPAAHPEIERWLRK